MEKDNRTNTVDAAKERFTLQPMREKNFINN